MKFNCPQCNYSITINATYPHHHELQIGGKYLLRVPCPFCNRELGITVEEVVRRTGPTETKEAQ